MSGLTQKDMQILQHYSEKGNRELYWNYLSQREGNDGYGTLALGVVRNDNMPGAVANEFAANHAKTYSGRALTERQWEEFGIDLMQKDFAERQRYMSRGQTDLALNLPVKDVQNVHDRAFDRAGIDMNAWTPRQLLEAARRQGGDQEAEKVWTTMLDNGGIGSKRMASTLYDTVYQYNDEKLPATSYLGSMTLAAATASQSLDNRDPNKIGATTYYDMYSERDGKWYTVNSYNHIRPLSEVKDPTRIAELNDIRELRLHRQELSTQFHPDDPARTRGITESPFTISHNAEQPDKLDPTHPDHKHHRLYAQALQGTEALDQKLGRTSDHYTLNMAASLTDLAVTNKASNIKSVYLSEEKTAEGTEVGRNVFIRTELAHGVHSNYAMPTEVAANTPAEESFKNIEQTHQAQQLAQTQQQQEQVQRHEQQRGPVMT